MGRYEMRIPNLINVEYINHENTVFIDGWWVRARPESLYRWTKRFTLAWGVFVGKYDALVWYKQ